MKTPPRRLILYKCTYNKITQVVPAVNRSRPRAQAAGVSKFSDKNRFSMSRWYSLYHKCEAFCYAFVTPIIKKTLTFCLQVHIMAYIQFKPLSKRSKKISGVFRERLVGGKGAAPVFRMALRGRPETVCGVGADGNPVRYQWGAYDGAQNEWAIRRQFGWYRRSFQAFVPCIEGQRLFLLSGSPRICKKGVLSHHDKMCVHL